LCHRWNKKELEQLTNTLNENDNPVLMLVKLKKLKNGEIEKMK
jgi:hypothetical protein